MKKVFKKSEYLTLPLTILAYFLAVGRAPTHEIINTEISEFTLQCEVNIYSSHCNAGVF